MPLIKDTHEKIDIIPQDKGFSIVEYQITGQDAEGKDILESYTVAFSTWADLKTYFQSNFDDLP